MHRSTVRLGKEDKKRPAFVLHPAPGREGNFTGREGALITRTFPREPKHVRAVSPGGPFISAHPPLHPANPRPARAASRDALWPGFLCSPVGGLATWPPSCSRPLPHPAVNRRRPLQDGRCVLLEADGLEFPGLVISSPPSSKAHSPGRLSRRVSGWAALAHSHVKSVRLGEARRSGFPA